MAVIRERVRSRAVHASAVILLKSAEVCVCNGNQLLPRHLLRRRNGLEPKLFGLMRLIHIGNVVRTTTTWFEIDALNLRDATQFDTQSQTHEYRSAGFNHGSHISDLSKIGIGENVCVLTATFNSLPKSIANLHDLIVFGVHHILRQGELRWIVSNKRRQI